MKKNNGYLKRPFALIGLVFFVTVWLLATFGTDKCVFLLPFFFSVILLILLFRFKERAAVLIVISITAVSACLCFLEQERDFQKISSMTGEQCCIVGTLSEIPGNGKSNIIVDTKSINSVSVNTKINISIYNAEDIGFDYYDEITVKAKTFSLEKFNRNTANSYKSKGIFLTGYCGIDDIKLESNPDKPIMYQVKKLKDAICESVLDKLPNENGGLIIALVLGDKSFITDKTESAFSVAGISHLTAVSGMHTYFWSSMIFAFLRKFISERKSAVFCIIFLLFFMTLTGFTPSVVRAGVMVILTYCACLFRKKSDSLNAIGLSAVVIVMFNPFAVCSVGTLLSFSAALGLILMRDRIQNLEKSIFIRIKIGFVRKIVLSVFNILLTSSVATVATLPVMVFTIGGLSLMSIIGNLLTVNISMYIMIAGGIGAVLCLLPHASFLGYPFFFVSGIMSKVILKTIDYMSNFSFLYVSVNDWFIKAFVIATVSVFVLMAIVKPQLMKNKTVVLLTAVNLFVISCIADFFIESLSLKVDCIGTESSVCVLLTKGENAVLLGECSDNYCIRQAKDILNSLDQKTLDIASDRSIKRADIQNFCDSNTLYISENTTYKWCGYMIELVRKGKDSYYKITGDRNIFVLMSGEIDCSDECDIVIYGKKCENTAENISAEKLIFVSEKETISRFYF